MILRIKQDSLAKDTNYSALPVMGLNKCCVISEYYLQKTNTTIRGSYSSPYCAIWAKINDGFNYLSLS